MLPLQCFNNCNNSNGSDWRSPIWQNHKTFPYISTFISSPKEGYLNWSVRYITIPQCFYHVCMYIPHFSVKNEYIDNFGGHWGHLKVVDRSNIENREYLQMSKIILNCSQLNLSQTLPQSHFLLLLHPPFYFCQKTWLSSLWVNLYFLCYLILQYFLFSYPSSWKSY